MERHSIASLFLGGVGYFNSREEFEELTGQQPKPFDPSGPPKFWRHHGTIGPLDYETLKDGKYVPASTDNAGEVNLPGRYTYPRFEAAPTEAYILNQNSKLRRLDPMFLCLPGDAAQLSRELSAAGIVNETMEATFYRGFKINYPADEPRRKIYVRVDGNNLGAGLLWEVRNRHVGQTGEWEMGDFGPIFNPATPITSNTLPAVPVPYRALKDGERLVSVFGGWAVETGEPDPGGESVDLSGVLENQERIISMLLEPGERE